MGSDIGSREGWVLAAALTLAALAFAAYEWLNADREALQSARPAPERPAATRS